MQGPTVPSRSVRGELEARLGPRYSLDGSFASLWAIDRILDTLRAEPPIRGACPWIPEYVAAVVARACAALGARAPELDLEGALERWSSDEAGAPDHGRAPAFARDAIARGVGSTPDAMEAVGEWLVGDLLDAAPIEPALRELARPVVAAMVLGAPDLEHRARSHRILDALEPLDATSSRAILDALVASQDRSIRLLAGWASVYCGVPPDRPHEAWTAEEAIEHFGMSPPPFVASQIAQLRADRDDEAAELAWARRTATFDAERGRRLFGHLLAAGREAAGLRRWRGWCAERCGDLDAAETDYARAIALDETDAGALRGRGLLRFRRGAHAAAEEDLLAAQRLLPSDPRVRHARLVMYLRTLVREAR